MSLQSHFFRLLRSSRVSIDEGDTWVACLPLVVLEYISAISGVSKYTQRVRYALNGKNHVESMSVCSSSVAEEEPKSVGDR